MTTFLSRALILYNVEYSRFVSTLQSYSPIRLGVNPVFYFLTFSYFVSWECSGILSIHDVTMNEFWRCSSWNPSFRGVSPEVCFVSKKHPISEIRVIDTITLLAWDRPTTTSTSTRPQFATRRVNSQTVSGPLRENQVLSHAPPAQPAGS
jgi:hypothetical protein